MDWKTFLAAIIDHLAWPGIVLIGILLFKKHLGNLINRIRSIKGKDIEFAEIQEKMTEIKSEVEPLQQQVIEVKEKLVSSEVEEDRKKLVEELEIANKKLGELENEKNRLLESMSDPTALSLRASIIHAEKYRDELERVFKLWKLISPEFNNLQITLASFVTIARFTRELRNHNINFYEISQDELIKIVGKMLNPAEHKPQSKKYSRVFPVLMAHKLLEEDLKLTPLGAEVIKSIARIDEGGGIPL